MLPAVSVVIPALNEGKTIGLVIRTAKKGLLGIPHEIIVVDGNSSDKTREIAKREGAKVLVEKKRGYGRAYRTGISASRGGYIVMVDGDGTYPSERIGEFYRTAESFGADVVIGSRFSGRMFPGSMSPINRLGNFLITLTTNFLFGTRLSDSQSGMRVYRSESLKRLSFSSDGMEFASELNVLGKRAGLEPLEIPISYRVRSAPPKLNPLSDGFRHFKYLFGAFFNRAL